MARVSVRPAFLFAVALSAALLLAGCSGADPVERANGLITGANESIDEHNRLYEEAHAAYEEAQEAIEAADDPSEETDRVSEARDTLEEARASLLEARDALGAVQDVEVEDRVRDYAAVLAEGVDAQIAAENQELEYYRMLEEDPALEDDREGALDLLAGAQDGYDEAQDAYARARQIADANPELIG